MKKRFLFRKTALFLIAFCILSFFSTAYAQENTTLNKALSTISIPDVPEIPSLGAHLVNISKMLQEPAAETGSVFIAIAYDFSRDIIKPIARMPEQATVFASMPLRRVANFAALSVNSISSAYIEVYNTSQHVAAEIFFKKTPKFSNQAAVGANGIIGSFWNSIIDAGSNVLYPLFAPSDSAQNFITHTPVKVGEDNVFETGTNVAPSSVPERVVVAGTSNSLLLKTIALLTLRIDALENRPSTIVNNYVADQTASLGDSISRLITSNNTNVINNITNVGGSSVDQSNMAITGGTITGVNATTTDLNVTGNLSFDGLYGSAGQVLTSQGEGTTPTWETVSGGGSVATSTIRNMFTASSPLAFSTTTGDFSVASGYSIPLTASTTEWAAKVSSQWTTSGSNIYFNTGNVGIGTTTPTSKFTIGSGQIEVPTGSASAPSYSFSNDLNTGMYRVGVNSLGFSTDGVGRLTIDVSGHILVGPSVVDNSSYNFVDSVTNGTNGGTSLITSGAVVAQGGLNVNMLNDGLPSLIISPFSGGTSDIVNIYDSTFGPALFITADGKTGIGTTTPDTKLSVQGDVSWGNYGARMGDWEGLSGYNVISLNGLWGSNNENIMAGGPGAADPNLYFNVPVGGAYFFSENEIGGSGTAVLSTANGIQVTEGSAASPTHTFLTYADTGMFLPAAQSLGFSTVGTERLRISATGNVGIGTTTPSQALTVAGKGLFASSSRQILIDSSGDYQYNNIGSYYGGQPSITFLRSDGAFAGGIAYQGNAGGMTMMGGNGTAGNAGTLFLGSLTAELAAGGTNAARVDLSNATYIKFTVNAAAGEAARFNSLGYFGIGTTTPATSLSVVGTTTLSNLLVTGSNDAPAIRLTPKTLLTTPQNGGLEYNGTNLYYTFGSTRQKIDPFTVYVDPDSGSDSNTGSLSSPVQTISKAVSLIGTSGTIVLGGGTYVNERINLASIKSIQVQTKQNERAKVILGEAVTDFTQVDTNTWRSTNTISSVPSTDSAGTGGTDADYIFEHGTPEGSIPADEQHALLENRTTLLDHYRLRLATNQANVNAGNGRWWYSGGYLYISATDGGDPNGTTYYVPNTTSGMSFVYNAQSDSTTEYVKIEGVEVYYGNTGFDLTYVRDYELNGVTAYGNYGTGITGQTNRSGVEKHVKVLANGDDGIAHLTEANPTSATTDGNYLSVDVLAIGNGDEGISGHYNVTETVQGGLMYYNYSGGITPALGAHTSAYNVTTMRNAKGFDPCCSTSSGSAGTTTLNVYNSRSYKDNHGFFADGEDILNVYNSMTDGAVSGVAALGSGTSGKINFYGHTDYSGTTSIYGGAGAAGISYRATTQYASSTFANNANLNLWGGQFNQYSDNGSTLVNLIASSSKTYFNGGNLDANSFGIGTTTATARLAIVGKYNGTAKLFTIANDLAGDGEMFTVLQRGNVGIGSSTPSHKLSVVGNIDSRTLSLNREGYDPSNMLYIGGNVSSGGDPTYRGSIVLDVPGGINGNGGLEFKAYSGSGGGSRITTADEGSAKSPLVFQTRRVSATWVERMRIESLGNVGIGTTTPGANLNVVSKDTSTISGLFTGFSSGQTADIFQLAKNPGATAGLVFTAGGNLGVGTTTPDTKLDVQGDIAFGNYGARMGDWLGLTGYNSLSLNGLWDGINETFVMGGPDSADPILYMNVPTGGEYNFAEGGMGSGNVAVINSSHGISVNMGSASGPTHTFLSDNLTGMFSPGGSSLAFSTGGTESMRINSSGNVGVGTTTPSAKLDIYGNLNVATGTTPALFVNTASGKVGIGTASPSYPLSVSIPNTAQTMVSFASPLTTLDFAYDGSANMRISSSRSLANFAGSGYDHLWYDNADLNMVIKGATGNVGIGTSTPSSQLTTTGTVQFFGITGGTLQTDAVGNVTVLSDERLKDISGEFTRGLEDIQKINPISFHWKESTGYDTGSLYSGFSAQNIQSAIPEAVLTNSEGFLSLQDRPILATAINAIKQLGSVFSKIENGVAYLKEVWITGPLHIDNDICVDDVCVTKQQFKQLLINSGSTSVPVPPTGGNSTGSDNNNSGATSTDVVVDPETPPDEVVTPPTEPPTPDEVVTPPAEPPTPDVVVTPPTEPVAEVAPEPAPSEGQ